MSSATLKSSIEELGFDFRREKESSHSLLGDRKIEMSKHRNYEINLCNLDGDYIYDLDALEQDIISIDNSGIKQGPWIRIKKIMVSFYIYGKF